jgi:hypothetical protein
MPVISILEEGEQNMSKSLPWRTPGKIVGDQLKTVAKNISVIFLFTVALTCIANRPALAGNFGALAYDPTSGASGYSYDYASQQDANLRAHGGMRKTWHPLRGGYAFRE